MLDSICSKQTYLINYGYIIQGLSLSTQSGLSNIKTYFSFTSIEYMCVWSEWSVHFLLQRTGAFPTLQLCTSSPCLKSLPISHHNPNHLSWPAESLPILQNSPSHCRSQRTSSNSLNSQILLSKCQIPFTLLYLPTDGFNFSQLVSHLASF